MKSYFFNAEPTTDLETHPTGYDREYDADDHAEFFQPFFTAAGVFAGSNADACKVTVESQGAEVVLRIAEGAVYAKGRAAVLDGTETVRTKADCKVVARMNKTADVRAFQLLAVTELVQTEDVYDVELGAVVLTPVMGGFEAVVEDTRSFMAFSGQPPYYPPDSEGLPYDLWLYTMGFPMTEEQKAAVEANPDLMKIFVRSVGPLKKGAVLKANKATVEEAQAGADDGRWMTPKTTLDAIESPTAHATMQDAEIGADTSKIMDAASTLHSVLFNTLGPGYICVKKRYEYPKGTPLVDYPVRVNKVVNSAQSTLYYKTDSNGYIQITGDTTLKSVLIFALPVLGFTMSSPLNGETVTKRGLTILPPEVLTRDYGTVPDKPSVTDIDYLTNNSNAYKIFPPYSVFKYYFDFFAVGGGGAGTYSVTTNGASGATNGAAGGAGGFTTTKARVALTKWTLTMAQIGAGGVGSKTPNTPGGSGGTSAFYVYNIQDNNTLLPDMSVSCQASSGAGAGNGSRSSGASGGSGAGGVDAPMVGASGSNGASGASLGVNILGGTGQGTTTRKWGEGLGNPYSAAGGGSAVQNYAETPTLTERPSGYGAGVAMARDLSRSGTDQKTLDTTQAVARDNFGGGGGGISIIKHQSALDPIITKTPNGGSGLVSVRWRA